MGHAKRTSSRNSERTEDEELTGGPIMPDECLMNAKMSRVAMMEFTHARALGTPAVSATKEELTESLVTGLYDPAYLGGKHVPGKNLLYCVTFPLVWEEVALVGGSPMLIQYSPPVCVGIQGPLDYKNDIDPSSWYAAAGFGPPLQQKILEQMHHHFQGASSPRLLPDVFEAERLYAYSYFFKHLTYDEREGTFARIATGPSPGDFVLDLPTLIPEEHLVVASIPPGETLADTVSRAMAAPFAPSRVPAAWALEQFQVPAIHFDVTWKFRTTAGRYHFKLDERGATLLSEAAQISLPLPPIIVARAGSRTPRPILVALTRRGARRPYFAAWIENTELLLPDVVA